MKINFILIIAFLSLGLCGCGSHTNPLTTASSRDVGKFLVTASMYAEDKLHIFSGGDGSYYGDCMDRYTSYEKDQQKQCRDIYKLMAEYAQKNPKFKGLTVSDLTNRKAYQAKLKKAYYQESMYGQFKDGVASSQVKG